MAAGSRVVQTIDGTPEKHIFRGMIADYDLQTGLCELIDNALDFWAESKRRSKLKINISLDVGRQIITVKDNAGGVKRADLRLLIAPGASRDTTTENLIGIFGVGGKRAGVALGELVEIRTQHKSEQSHKIEIDNEWLQQESWEIEYTECAAIGAGCTIVEISKLRQPFVKSDVDAIRRNLGETYPGACSHWPDDASNALLRRLPLVKQAGLAWNASASLPVQYMAADKTSW